MSITYPLSLPTSIGFGSVEFTARNVTGVSESPFTLNQQVLQWDGERWEVDVSLPPMKRDLAEEWVVFLMSLKGRVGTFLLGDPNATNPQGNGKNYSDTILTRAEASIGDTSFSFDGATNSVTNYLKAGDYIQVGTGSDAVLYKCLEASNSNASGQLNSVEVWPSVRKTTANNTAVSIFNAKGLFRLNQPNMTYSINEISSYGIGFSAVEAR